MNEERFKREMEQLFAQAGGRNSTHIFRHYYTCRDAFIDHEVYLVKAMRNKDPDLRGDLALRQMACRDIVVVFAHLFLEATIYDYGATSLSDSYVKRHVDKLNFLSKWVVIPRLVTGKSFPTDSHAYHLLGKLTKSRNSLAHFKTRRVSDTNMTDTIRNNTQNQVGPSECFDCMSEALRELFELGPEQWLPFQWGAVRNLMNKEYRQIEEATIREVHLARDADK